MENQPLMENQPGLELPETKKSHTLLAVIISVVVTAAIAGGGVYFWANQIQSKLSGEIVDLKNDIDQLKQQAEISQTTNQESGRTDGQDFGTKYYEYKLQTQYEKWDQQLIRRNRQTNEEVAVINSIKEAIPELKAEFNLLLYVFAHPENSEVIFFKSALVDTNNPGGVLYSFNTADSKFTKMKVNDVYNGFYGGFALSPDQTKFIWVPDAQDESGKAQTMYLIDLINDKYSIAVNLSGNETFNAGFFAMSSHFEVSWINEGKIKYAVFDQSKKGTGFDPYSEDKIKSILIGYREINI